MTRRRRNLLNRIGVVASVFFAVCWVVSLKDSVILHYKSAFLGMGDGLVGGGFGSDLYPESLGLEFMDNTTVQWLLPIIQWPGRSGYVLALPAWMLIVLSMIPTLVLWRRGQAPLPNHCKCGYNLTGNVSGACPECGVAIEKA